MGLDLPSFGTFTGKKGKRKDKSMQCGKNGKKGRPNRAGTGRPRVRLGIEANLAIIKCRLV